jgi:hypothetical protein
MLKISWEVRTRVLSKGCFKRSRVNEDLCVKWDLDLSILKSESE